MSSAILLKKHPLLVYFGATFVISWGGVLLVIGPGGVPEDKERMAAVLPFAIGVMLLGPSVAGLMATALASGRAGFRELFARLRTWRVGVRWYAAALLIGPSVSMAIWLVLSLISPVFVPGIFDVPDKGSRLMFGIGAALVTGFLEELGWTGFAIPRMRLRHGILGTGLIVGVLWGAWHVIGPAFLASGSYAGELSTPLFLAARTIGLLIGGLPAYRILMVWVYDRTNSLLVAMLMHASMTAVTLIAEPLAISGVAVVISDAVSVCVWWVVVAVVAVATRRRFSRPSLRPQMA